MSNSAGIRSLARTESPVLVVLIIAGWTVVRALQLHYLGWGTGYDVNLYQQYAQHLGPGALVLAATYCLHARRPRASAIFLGMAGAVKLWPFALVPLWLAWEYRRSIRRSIAMGMWIGAGAVLAALPVLPRAGWNVLSF